MSAAFSINQVIKRIALSVRVGALMGAGFAIIATIVTWLTGPDTLASQGISLHQLLLIYLVRGTVGGGVVGVLLPVASQRIGAAITGMLVTAGIWSLLHVATNGFNPWTANDVLNLVLYAVMLGLPCGLVVREVFNDGQDKPPS